MTHAGPLWAGSDEWEPWTQAPRISVLRVVPSDSFHELWLVEASFDPPRRYLLGFGEPVPEAHRFPRAARAFNVPDDWSGGALTLTDLTYAGDVVVAADRDDAPSLSPEQQERRRKGWAF